jgi:hypothetical protein
MNMKSCYLKYYNIVYGHGGRYRMVVGFLTTYAIAEILLKVALNTITPSMALLWYCFQIKLQHSLK